MACIACVVRICCRYANMDVLEDRYGINMLPLAQFSQRVYADDPCSLFKIKGGNADILSKAESDLIMKMHKAISVIQFKLDGQMVARRKSFDADTFRLWDKMDFEKGEITLEGKTYKMLDMNFPTVDPENPFKLTEHEKDVMDRLQHAFLQCSKLQEHMRLMLNKGSLYKIYNNNLLYHGCIPLKPDGSMEEVPIYGKKYSGKALYDVLETYIRKAFFAVDPSEKEKGKDILWFIWNNKRSPLFGKSKMATFERYFLAEKETHKEKKNPYYENLENEEVMNNILKDFGLDTDAHIINGHVPVHQSSGESPVKCGGKVLMIDGGFSKAYQSETGIAGYTLTYNSYGMKLVAHMPFTSTEDAIARCTDIHSEQIMQENSPKRIYVGDTDTGKRLRENIADLTALLEAYRSGKIREKV